MNGVAIVTGASTGLGLAIAELLSEGMTVVGVSRRAPHPRFADPLPASRGEGSLGPSPRVSGERVAEGRVRGILHVAGDASRSDTAARAIAAAEGLGTIELLVNCAGAGIFGPAGSYDDDAIARVLNANLVSTIIFCNALFPLFREHGGTIVNVLSTAALAGKPNESVYCAAKWGARGYTESLKAEAKGTKARVMSVAPGGMNTPFWPEPREGFMDPKDVAAVVVDAINRGVNVSDLVITR